MDSRSQDLCASGATGFSLATILFNCSIFTIGNESYPCVKMVTRTYDQKKYGLGEKAPENKMVSLTDRD